MKTRTTSLSSPLTNVVSILIDVRGTVQRGDVLVHERGVSEQYVHAILVVLEAHAAHPRARPSSGLNVTASPGTEVAGAWTVNSLMRTLLASFSLAGRMTGAECGMSPKLPNVTAFEIRSALPPDTGTTA